MRPTTVPHRLGAALLLPLLLLLPLGAGCAHKKPSSLASTNGLRKIGNSKVIVEMRGLPEDASTGTIHVTLWGSEESFMHGQQWIRAVAIPIARAHEPCTITKLPPGTYSLTAYYDASNRAEFRRDADGIPLDPWAVSRGSPANAAPSWERSKFELEEGATVVELDFQHPAATGAAAPALDRAAPSATTSP
jgi:uncharacterized protein (DUF2141 family)